jgi:hypothetical protein
MNLKQKLAELLSPMGAGNNVYELGQLAQQQSALIEDLVYAARYANSRYGGDDDVEQALQKAKDAGYL